MPKNENAINDINDLTFDLSNVTFKTANEIVNEVGGNYTTIRKYLSFLASLDKLKIENVNINGRKFPAFSVNGEVYKHLQTKIKDNKKSLLVNKNINDKIKNENASTISNTNEFKNENVNDSIVKFYEVVSENNVLKNEINKLKNEVNDLKMDNIKIDSESKVKDSKILLLEDKKQTYEAEVAKINQKLNKTEAESNKKSKIILVLASVIGLIITVIVTVFFMLYLVKI